MNFRFMTLFWVGVIVVSAVGLYMVKYRVQAIQENIAQAQAQLREERQALHILTAEWAYLNRPERLQALNDKYLKAEPVTGDQMVELATVPYPAAPGEEATAVHPASMTPSNQGVIDDDQ